MIYLTIILLLFFLIYAYDIMHVKEGKNAFFFTLLGMLVLIAGLAYRVGIDHIRYSEDFLQYPTLYTLDLDYIGDSREDPLWVIMTATFRTFTNSYMWLHLFHTAIVNSAILLFMRRYSYWTFTPILLYCFTLFIFFNFETVRESLAVAVFLLAYPYLERKQWVKYYLVAITCFFIHSSALLAFLLPPLLALARKNVGKLLVISIILMAVLGRVVNDIILNSLQFIMVNQRIAYKLSVYLGREDVGIALSILLKNVVFPAIVLVTHQFILKSNTRFLPFTKLFLILGAMSMFIPVIDRLLNYLFIFYLVNMGEAICLVVARFREPSFKFLASVAFVLAAAIGPVSWHFTIDNRISEYNYHRYFPYHTYFTRQEDDIRERFYRNGS